MAIGKHSEVKAICLLPCGESYFPGWLFKTAYFTFSFLSCPPSSHQTLKNLEVHHTSWVLVSVSSESKPNVKALHCAIHGLFLSHSERSFVELKILLDSVKCMTPVSGFCMYCWGWTWLREPGLSSQNPHCSFPFSFTHLKMLYSPGSSAREFIWLRVIRLALTVELSSWFFLCWTDFTYLLLSHPVLPDPFNPKYSGSHQEIRNYSCLYSGSKGTCFSHSVTKFLITWCFLLLFLAVPPFFKEAHQLP